MNCLIFTGMLITIISSIFIYRISRFFLNRAFSTLVVLNFLFVFAFGCYSYSGIFNFILPYTFSSTFFIMFVFSAVYFFIKFIHKERYKYLFWWGLSVYFASLSRIWMSLGVWAVFVFIGLVYACKNRKFSIIIYVFLPFLLSLLSYGIFLYSNKAFGDFLREVVIKPSFLKGSRFKREILVSGVSNPSNNLVFILKSFFLQIAGVSLLYLVSGGLSLVIKKSKVKVSNVLVCLLLGVISFTAVSHLLKFMPYFEQYKLMPLVLISGMAVCFFRLFFGKNVDYRRCFSHIILFSISFILILRRVLNANPNHYGFFLLPLGLICYYIFFVELYPTLALNRFIKMDSKVKSRYFFSLSIFFALLIFPFIRQNYTMYERKAFTVSTNRGKISSFANLRSKRFWETVLYLVKNTPKDSTVFVIPQGVGINFFSGRNNPTRVYRPHACREDILIQLLAEHRIDYIVILKRIFYEYGGVRFGIDCHRKAHAWIRDNYQLVKQFGPYPFTSDEFGVAIFKRKGGVKPILQ